MAGAITAAAADKAARFLQLCDAFGLPVVSLVDCPGYMVGPAAEAEALVRRASRMLVAGAALRVPLVAVVLRRGYGLGAQAMVGGSLHEPLLTVAWPGAHLGPMGLEGAVRLGLRKELEQIADDDEREERVRQATAAAEENAKALNAAAAVRDRRRHRSRRHPRPDRRDAGGGRVARTTAARPAVRGHLVSEKVGDGAAMAPLGEWSLEATILVGARGMPGTVASSNVTPGRDIQRHRPPVRRRPPETGGERAEVQADSANNRRSRTG